MSKRPRLFDEIDDINIMPLLNIIMLLIPFLIMSTEFTRIGILEVSSPSGCGCSTPSPYAKATPPLVLTLTVTAKGATLLTRGARIPQGCDLSAESMKAARLEATGAPTIPRIGKDIDQKAFQQCLIHIKNLFPHERRIIMTAEMETPFQEMISLMDSAREDQKKQPLFPEILFSAGFF